MSHVGKGNLAGDVLTWDGVKWVWAQPTTPPTPAVIGPFATIDQATLDPLGRLVDFNTTGLADGTTAWVNSVEAWFTFEATSVLVADGITIAQPVVGPGRWLRIFGGSIKWFQQTTWFVNPATGDDENVGNLVGAPLRTLNELGRRYATVGNQPNIVSTVTVTVAAGNAGELTLDVTLAGGVFFIVQGAITSTAPSAIDSVVNTNPATNTRGSITDAPAVFVERQRLRLTSGANTGALAYVTRVPVAGTANVTQWGIVDPLVSDAPTIVNAAAGNDYVIDTLATQIPRLNLHVRGTGVLLLRDIAVLSQFHELGTGVRVYGCIFTIPVFNDSQNPIFLLSQTFGTFVARESTLAFRTCVFFGGVMFIEGNSQMNFTRSACFDDVILFQRQGGKSSFTTPCDAQFIDSLGKDAAIAIEPGTTIDVNDAGIPFWGTDNVFPFAIIVRGGAKIVYISMEFRIAGGTTADVRIGAFSRAYADLPIFNTVNDCGIYERPI